MDNKYLTNKGLLTRRKTKQWFELPTYANEISFRHKGKEGDMILFKFSIDTLRLNGYRDQKYLNKIMKGIKAVNQIWGRDFEDAVARVKKQEPWLTNKEFFTRVKTINIGMKRYVIEESDGLHCYTYE